MFRRLSPRNMPWNFRVFAALVITIAAGGYFFFDSGKRELYVIIPGTLLILLSGVCIGIMWRKRREMFYKAQYLASKEAEEAIAGSEQNLAVTLQSIGDAVIATDAGSRITRINPVAEKLTGWSAAEAIGRPLPEVFQIIDEETGHTVAPRREQSWTPVRLQDWRIIQSSLPETARSGLLPTVAHPYGATKERLWV